MAHGEPVVPATEAVVGYHRPSRTWRTTKDSRSVPVPELVGEFRATDPHLVAASTDFGHAVSQRPSAVLYPGTSGDIAAINEFAVACGLTVVPRGAGHSVDGQALVANGIVVDMRAMSGIAAVSGDRVEVAAGTTWRAVLDSVLPLGLTPPVLTDYLDLTVGGTLSAGGFGGQSYRHGSQAEHVLALDVVTTDGELLRCSATRNPELFHAVRGGQGRAGIITKATIALHPAPAMVRRYHLDYPDLAALLAEQRRLMADQRFGYLQGQARYVEDAGWRYVLDVAAASTAPTVLDNRELLRGLNYLSGSEEIDDLRYREFLDRMAPTEQLLRALGSWQHDPHPWCNLLLPSTHAERFIADTLAELGPADIGAGGVLLIYPVTPDPAAAPNVPSTNSPHSVLFAVLRTASRTDPGQHERMRCANAELITHAKSVGGTVYPNWPAS